MPTRTYEPIQSINGSGSSTVNFSTLPTNYTDLILVVSNLSLGSLGNGLALRFNGDSGSNYSVRKSISGSGTNPVAMQNINTGTSAQIGYATIGYQGEPGTIRVDIMSYRQTSFYKPVLAFGGDMSSEIAFDNSCWLNTNAITSIQVQSSASIGVNTILTLYGILAGNA